MRAALRARVLALATAVAFLVALGGLPGARAGAPLVDDAPGLVKAAHCPSGLAIVDDPTGACTHGADGPSAAETPSQLQGLPPRPLKCSSSARDDFRVEVLYVRPQGTASRLGSLRQTFAGLAGGVDAVLGSSSEENGSPRAVRWLMADDCSLVVRDVALAPGALDAYQSTVAALRRAGFTRVDRRYLVMADVDVMCGIAGIYQDDRGSPAQNHNNIYGPLFARVDRGCWSVGVVAHELLHSLGAHQPAAPDSDGGFHCVQPGDLMCAGSEVAGVAGCAGLVVDCGKNSYFNVAPPAGSYLAARWNVADSAYLWNPDAELSVATDAPATSSAGHEFSIRVEVANPGTRPVDGVRASLRLAPALRPVGVRAPGAGCDVPLTGGSTVRCEWHSRVAPGATTVMVVRVQVSPAARHGSRVVSVAEAAAVGRSASGTGRASTDIRSLLRISA